MAAVAEWGFRSGDQVSGDHVPTRIIEASSGWAPLKLRELWRYRELLYFLIWRDVKVRYKQTALGGAWAILQPVATMLVFSIIFGYLARVPSDGVPYPIFTYAALLPWQLFAHALTESGNSLVMNQQLLKKVYFPRLLIPIAAALAGLVDVGCAVLAAIAVGLWLAALNVQYRDVRYTLPFLTQLWFFATPVAYSSSLIPEPWRVWFGLNPMAGIVDGFRWALLGTSAGGAMLTLTSLLVVVVLLIGGVFYFRRMERSFADLV